MSQLEIQMLADKLEALTENERRSIYYVLKGMELEKSVKEEARPRQVAK